MNFEEFIDRYGNSLSKKYIKNPAKYTTEINSPETKFIVRYCIFMNDVENFTVYLNRNFYLDKITCNLAIQLDKVDILQLIFSKIRDKDRTKKYFKMACLFEAIESVKFLTNFFKEYSDVIELLKYCIDNLKFNILEELLKIYTTADYLNGLTAYCVDINQLEYCKFLFGKGASNTREIFIRACEKGRVSFVIYLQFYVPPDIAEFGAQRAVACGHIELVNYFMNNFNFDYVMLTESIRSSQINIIELFEDSIFFEENLRENFKLSVINNEISTILYIIDKIDMDYDVMLFQIIQYGSIGILSRISEIYGVNYVDVLCLASKSSRIDIVSHIFEERNISVAVREYEPLYNAYENMDIDMLELMINREPIPHNIIINMINRSDNVELVNMLLNYLKPSPPFQTSDKLPRDRVCAICLCDDKEEHIIFNCTHNCCSECYKKITSCHMCRGRIVWCKTYRYS